jgi:uncharacterized NAD(P)/FAD-binding protein YdhS
MMKTVAVVGGGYSGAAFAVHLSRTSPKPVRIVVVEQAEALGAGLAHGARHPDHRLNGPDAVHFLYPGQPEHFGDWMRRSGALERDPEALTESGAIFARRADFGAYVAAQVSRHQNDNPSGSEIVHVRDPASGLAGNDGGLLLRLSQGEPMPVALCVLATGQEKPGVPPLLEPMAGHRKFFGDPWDLESLARIGPDDPVLILGTGLTTADVIVTLVRQGHVGPIRAISRRGLRPQPQNIFRQMQSMWEKLERFPPEFIERHGSVQTAAAALRALREDIGDGAARDVSWYECFDGLRDAVTTLWPSLPECEKARFMRHLKPWYDTHRFRIPPQTEAIVHQAEATGQVRFEAARLARVDGDGEGFVAETVPRGGARPDSSRLGAIVNCTGPDSRLAASRNGFIAEILRVGWIRPGPLGLGIDVDHACRAITPGGEPSGRLYALGPPTSPSQGETLSVPFITRQIDQMLPGVIARITGP